MQKTKKLLVLFILLSILSLTICSCDYALDAEYGELSFYGNKFEYMRLEYDMVADLYRATIYEGTYTIYPNISNPNELLITLNFSDESISDRTYSFEKGINENNKEFIMINGKEFIKTGDHPFGYFILKTLSDLGIIQ